MHNYPWIHDELSAFPGSVRDYKVEWNWIRYLIGGKMFAAVCIDDKSDEEVLLTLKLEPLESDLLRQQYEDIIPGYYMNKLHWNSVKLTGSVPGDIVRHMMAESYRLVSSSLTKKVRKDLGIEV